MENFVPGLYNCFTIIRMFMQKGFSVFYNIQIGWYVFAWSIHIQSENQKLIYFVEEGHSYELLVSMLYVYGEKND